MSGVEDMKIVQIGATGVVAETFREIIARPDIPFELEAIATAAHPELHNKLLRETHLPVPPGLEEVPIIGVTKAIESTDAPVIFSGLQAKMAARYEDRLAAGRLVVTNASANRQRPDVPLVSAFINPGQIDELFGPDYQDAEGRIIAGGNCMSAILAVPLAPIHREIGIDSMSVRTMQGWSGAGAKAVPAGAESGTQPIEGNESEKIQTEPNEFLSSTIGKPEDIFIGAEPRRAPWLRGHYARIALNLSGETSKRQIEELWRHFEAPEVLKDVRMQLRGINRAGGGDKWPARHGPVRPIKLEHGDLVRSDLNPLRLGSIQPMRVRAHILEFDPGDPSRIVIDLAGDNLIQGAVGGNLLNVIYARAQGYLQ